MRNNTTLTKSHSRACLAGLMVICSASAMADSWTEASGLLGAAGIDPNEAKFMKDHNLKIGGWLEGSVGANLNATHDAYNGPVTFNDRTAEVQMNQLYFYLQKAITVGGDAFDLGGRADFMYGTDAIFTQAYGNPSFDPTTTLATGGRGDWDLYLSDDRFYNLALPQVYAELNLPVGNGIDVKLGHFYTPIGYEVVTSPDNFFVTKPYTMQYGEPFTHTGMLASYTVNPNWAISAGAVTGSGTGGWDGNFNKNVGNWSFLGGVTWTSDDAGTSLALTSTAGEQSEVNSSKWAMYSLVGKHNFTDKLHYIIQHDHGYADNVATGNASAAATLAAGTATVGTQNAEWYGINQYLIYDVTDKLSAGLRAEWFRDNNGFRVNGPGRCVAGAQPDGSNSACGAAWGGYYGDNAAFLSQGSGYYALTAGLTYKPAKWINLRPNVRWDHSDQTKAFAGGNSHDQVLFTADAVITF
ncbi:porin [Methylomonas sp. 11b]|uniref:porin n=1 Tax=Methylomonas sp. 11b TaxID=1168169 RepID=UPI0005696A56|nr:porin [Methylomonas sp. 11b]